MGKVNIDFQNPNLIALEMTKLFFEKNPNIDKIYIACKEDWIDYLKEEIENYKEQITPAIILIPGIKGNTGAGINGVKAAVEQAIGSDIVFGDK